MVSRLRAGHEAGRPRGAGEGELRALSIRQPWAWLIVHGWKPVENRDWSTDFRGRFLVHASKGMTHDEYSDALRLVKSIRGNADGLPPIDQLPRGGVVGSAELVDCVTAHPSQYFFGRYGFVMRDPLELPFRPYLGQLGFFDIPDEPSSQRYTYAAALAVAEDLAGQLAPGCERIEIAGSIRRRRPDVGDVELLYIPRLREEPDPASLFDMREVNEADELIAKLERLEVLRRRLSVTGVQAFGKLNKLMVHAPSGIPVDLFAASPATWWNQLVCRTGPADLNTRICDAAINRGWHWNVYGPGFSRADHKESIEMHSEAEVFAFVGMPYREPAERT